MYPQTSEPPKGNPHPLGRGGGQSQAKPRAATPVSNQDAFHNPTHYYSSPPRLSHH